MNLFVLATLSVASIFALRAGKQSATTGAPTSVSGVPTTLPLDSSISSSGTVAEVKKKKKEKPSPENPRPEGGNHKHPHVQKMKENL